MQRQVVLAVVVLVGLAAASLSSGASLPKFPHASLESAGRYAGWVPSYTAARAADLHRVRFYLTPRNLALFDDLFWAVSDPESPRYAQYLTTDDITEIVSAEPVAIKTVIDWLQEQGAANIELSRNRDVITMAMPVHKVEATFGVSLLRFVTPDGHRQIFRSTKPYRLPAHIAPHVDLVTGLTDFPPLSKKALARQAAASSVPTAAGPGIPSGIVARARGGEDLVLDFTPVCSNGQFTKNANQLCADFPPSLASFTVTLSSISSAVGRQSRFGSIVPSCRFNGNYTVCTTTVKGWYYDAVNVSISAFFSNGFTSNPGYNPYPVLATPPIVPQSIWKQYNIPPNTLVTTNVTQCVVEFEQQYYAPSDLTLFFQQTGLPTNTPVTVIGPNNANKPGGEATLDIEYIMGVAPGAPTVFWSIDLPSPGGADPILEWALEMANTDNPPAVNSISYGVAEALVDKFLGNGYLARADFEFRKLALRGISVLIASADNGAGDLAEEPNCNTLHADWPSQSPYVTSIGSTIITPVAQPICYQQTGAIDCLNNPLGEIVVSIDQGLFWTTGGGFSNISLRATYQSQEVASYLNHKNIPFPASRVWNPNGRAYPDVAAVGHNLMCVLSGKFIPIDGTSASTPIFAGVVTLLNDARALAGLPPLGFLNPILYKASRERPQTFYDVVWGNNRCGALEDTPVCCPEGYHATDGWDAASGLGTPNFQELKAFVLNFPKVN